MDPVTAVGLVTNVAQLVEISWKIVSKSHEIYKHGASPEHRDTRTVTADLQNVSSKLIVFLNQSESQQRLSDDDEALRQLCKSSNKIAEEIIRRLAILKVDEGLRGFRSIRCALKSVWIKSELDEAALKLQNYRAQLNTRILVALRHKINHLDLKSTNIESKIVDGYTTFNTNQEIQTQYLTRLITSQHSETRTLLASLLSHDPPSVTVAPALQLEGGVFAEQKLQSVFFKAVETRDLNLLRNILRKDPSAVLSYNASGQTALHIAARDTSVDIATYLVRNGARINADDDDGQLPLHLAVQAGSEPMVHYLMSKGADPLAKDQHGNTPLSFCDPSSLIGWYVTHGVRPEIRNTAGFTALYHFVVEGDIPSVTTLLDHGDDIETVGRLMRTPLFEAVEAGDEEMTRFLLSRGASVYKVNERKATPLNAAAWHGHLRIGEMLLDHEAQIEAANVCGYTALSECCSHGHVDMGLMLLRRGAQAKHLDSTGFAPLHHATIGGCLPLVEELLNRGNNIEISDIEGRKALHLAAWCGKKNIVTTLLRHNAAVGSRDLKNRTPLWYASESGHTEISRLLEDANTVVNTIEHRSESTSP